MKHYSFIYFCAAFLRLTSSAPAFDLRIEYNKTFGKQTALDKMDVAFVNKVNLNETAFINNGIPKGKLLLNSNSKDDTSKQPLRYDSDKQSSVTMRSRADVKNLKSLTTTAFKQLQSHNIKQNLDAFSIAKRKTFFITPSFKYPNTHQYIDSFEANNVPSDPDFNNEFKYHSNSDNNNGILTVNLSNLDAKVPYRNKRYNQFNNKDKKIEDKDVLSVLSHPEIAEILKKQSSLIDKLENQLRTEKTPKLRSDFDDLLTSIENKKNKIETDMKQERITTTIKPQSTIMTMIDQTEIRKALMKDPFVQRILKMAKQKKIEYMKNAKKHYSNMLYI